MEHGSAFSNICASSPSTSERCSEHVVFKIVQSPHLVDHVLSYCRRLTCTPGSLAAKTSRKTLWGRLSAELGHQPQPLTPVLIENFSAVLSMQASAAPNFTVVKPNYNTGGFCKTFRSLNPRCWHCRTPHRALNRSLGVSARRREPTQYDCIFGTSC